MDENVQQTEPELKGIGGWLILVAIGLVLGAIIQAYTAIRLVFIFLGPSWNTLTNPDSMRYNYFWKPALIFEFICHIILLCYLVVLTVLFFSRSRSFPKLIIILYLFLPVYHFVDLMLADRIPFIVEHTREIQKGELAILKGVLACFIWIPYFCASRRVKNTFVE